MYPYMNSLPMQQIVRVNGEAGAHALRLPPNSSALVLDESAPLVWLCRSDGAGYMSVMPFQITEYKPTPTPSAQDLISRIERLEERMNESDHKRNGRAGAAAAAESGAGSGTADV